MLVLDFAREEHKGNVKTGWKSHPVFIISDRSYFFNFLARLSCASIYCKMAAWECVSFSTGGAVSLAARSACASAVGGFSLSVVGGLGAEESIDCKNCKIPKLSKDKNPPF